MLPEINRSLQILFAFKQIQLLCDLNGKIHIGVCSCRGDISIADPVFIGRMRRLDIAQYSRAIQHVHPCADSRNQGSSFFQVLQIRMDFRCINLRNVSARIGFPSRVQKTISQCEKFMK